MVERTRAYTRKMRAKHIKRKKRITSHYWSADTYPYYPHDGMYSKGKIHCSCRMCRSKDYNGRHVTTIQELRHGIGTKYPQSFEELDAGLVSAASTSVFQTERESSNLLSCSKI